MIMGRSAGSGGSTVPKVIIWRAAAWKMYRRICSNKYNVSEPSIY